MTLYSILLLLVLLFAITPAFGADEFMIVPGCGPRTDTDLEARYAEIAECNFNYAPPPVDYYAVTVEINKKILDICARHHMKYLVCDQRIQRLVLGKPEELAEGVTADVDGVIADYKGYPALAGYSGFDEPWIFSFFWVARVVSSFSQKDPDHPITSNLLPNYASAEAFGSGGYEDYVDKYCTIVKPKMLSFDHYAIFKDHIAEAAYFENFEIIRRQGLKHKLPVWCYVLITPVGALRSPTEAEIRWQVNTALAYGVKAIQYFTYWTPPGDYWGGPGAITWDGKKTEHYDQIKRVNLGLKMMAPVLGKLSSIAVYHTGKLLPQCKPLDSKSPVQVESDVPLAIGLFKHKDRSKWAIIVNRSLTRDAAVKMSFEPSVTSVKALNQTNGALEDITLNNGKASVNLREGDACLLKLR